MVHIVVAVLPVPAHAEKVLKPIQISNQGVNLSIGVEIGRISLFHPLPVSVQHLTLVRDHSHFNELVSPKLHPFLLAQLPVFIPLVAEIFQSNPNRVLRILYQIGGPVVEHLDSPKLYPHVLHIDPAIRHFSG